MNKNQKCFKCGSDAIIRLHYCERSLCAEHFVRMFDKRFRSTVREFRMIGKAERVAVGLSGGKDSTVLLRCLHELSGDLPMELVAITIDEGIAGYRSATLKIAKKEAKSLGIEHRVVSFEKEIGKTLDSILKTQGTGHRAPGTRNSLPCSWCGVLRRGLLNRAARETGADKLAMGHNLDDMAQTVLMNILRNEPSRTNRMLDPPAAGPGFVRRIRPLMRTPEKENAVYAMVRGMEMSYHECPYAQSAFRQLVRAQLNDMEELHPGTKYKILGSLLAMENAPGARFPARGQQPGLRACSSCGEQCGSALCKFCEMTAKVK
jgi:uncharacterized protein (TIGR00269 family)